jgi:hypothetical protein
MIRLLINSEFILDRNDLTDLNGLNVLNAHQVRNPP